MRKRSAVAARRMVWAPGEITKDSPKGTASGGTSPSRAVVDAARTWDELDQVIELSADTARLAVTPNPRGKPGGPGLYRKKGNMHSPYMQNIVKALIRKGMSPGHAYATAWNSMRKWSATSKHPEVRAASAGGLALEKVAEARAMASTPNTTLDLGFHFNPDEKRGKGGQWSGDDAEKIIGAIGKANSRHDSETSAPARDWQHGKATQAVRQGDFKGAADAVDKMAAAHPDKGSAAQLKGISASLRASAPNVTATQRARIAPPRISTGTFARSWDELAAVVVDLSWKDAWRTEGRNAHGEFSHSDVAAIAEKLQAAADHLHSSFDLDDNAAHAQKAADAVRHGDWAAAAAHAKLATSGLVTKSGNAKDLADSAGTLKEIIKADRKGQLPPGIADGLPEEARAQAASTQAAKDRARQAIVAQDAADQAKAVAASRAVQPQIEAEQAKAAAENARRSTPLRSSSPSRPAAGDPTMSTARSIDAREGRSVSTRAAFGYDTYDQPDSAVEQLKAARAADQRQDQWDNAQVAAGYDESSGESAVSQLKKQWAAQGRVSGMSNAGGTAVTFARSWGELASVVDLAARPTRVIDLDWAAWDAGHRGSSGSTAHDTASATAKATVKRKAAARAAARAGGQGMIADILAKSLAGAGKDPASAGAIKGISGLAGAMSDVNTGNRLGLTLPRGGGALLAKVTPANAVATVQQLKDSGMSMSDAAKAVGATLSRTPGAVSKAQRAIAAQRVQQHSNKNPSSMGGYQGPESRPADTGGSFATELAVTRVPAGQAGGGRFGSSGTTAPAKAGATAAKTAAAPPPPAGQKSLASQTASKNVKAKIAKSKQNKAGLLATAASARAKADALQAQMHTLKGELASASGKTSSGQAGSTTSSGASTTSAGASTTASSAPATPAASTATTVPSSNSAAPAAAAAATSLTAAQKTAIQGQIKQLTTQIIAYQKIAAQATKQAAAM